MGEITIKTEVGDVSDGYHTFNELYEHRDHLFLSLMKSNADISWFSRLHHDGSMFDGYFICGMDLPKGTVTYHMKESLIELCDGVRELDRAPEWDGHDSHDVLERLKNFCM